MPYYQNYQSISDCHEFWFKRFIICLHLMTHMWVLLLHILIHVFQLPANWLDVFLYNKLYPLQNDANKCIIWIIILFSVSAVWLAIHELSPPTNFPQCPMKPTTNSLKSIITDQSIWSFAPDSINITTLPKIETKNSMPTDTKVCSTFKT